MEGLPPDWGVDPGAVCTDESPRTAALELVVSNSIPGDMRPAKKGCEAGASVSVSVNSDDTGVGSEKVFADVALPRM